MKNIARNHTAVAALHALLAFNVAACSSDSTTLPASFKGPTAMVVAGTAHDRLFIANSGEDTVQVGALGSSIASFDLVRGDAVHFPLRIVAGPSPRGLAATPNGQYVVVLNGSGETLRLIDADALLPASVANTAVIVLAGPPDSLPSAIVAAPEAAADAPSAQQCTGTCVGRVYVALSGTGSVVTFEVRANDDGPALVPVRAYAVGGNPVALAVHPNGGWLYAIDAADNTVARIDLDSGAVVERLEVGDEPGALTVSNDGMALVVTRPRLSDLVVFSDITNAATASRVDSNAAYVEAPSCVQKCSSADPQTTGSLVCVGSDPSDSAICGRPDESGLQTVAGHEYQAVYLGSVPTRLVALGAAASQRTDGSSAAPTLTMTCDSTEFTYSQAVLVGLSGGTLVYVVLRADPSAPLAPALLSTTACVAPSIAVSTKVDHPEIAAPDLGSYLASCPAAPARARFACTDTSGGPGVVVMPGVTGSGDWSFDWDGVILDRSTGGRVDTYTPQDPTQEASFAFVDVASDLDDADIVPGDVLQLVTQPRQDAKCQAAVGTNPSTCSLEWSIVNVDTSQYPTRLILASRAQQLVPECYLEDGAIAYRTRAGQKYVVYRGSDRVGRAQAGDVVGPGGKVGANAKMLLSVTAAPPSGIDTSTCAFYDTAGLAQDASLRSLFSRDNAFGFTVTDIWSTVRTGYDFSQTSVPVAGTLPSDMTLVTLPGGLPVIFVIYAASNSLFLLEPYDIDTLTDATRSRVVR